MKSGISGRVVLVAGGTGGLGRAVSLAFLSAGDHVAVTHRNDDELSALSKAAGENVSRLSGHKVDVTNEADVGELVAKILGAHGALAVLVNTVGGYGGGAKLWEQDPALLNRMFDLNVRTGYCLARAAVPAMLKRGSGAIVNVAARAAFENSAGLSAYAASKAAAVAMMNSLAAELKATNVRVNSVLPSIIDTEANRKAMPGADYAKWPKPHEIARVIQFLASDDAVLIRGAAIPVFGVS